jgi:hypothetical protein
MLRLCSDSSRSYPGRFVRIAVPDAWDCALHGNMPGRGGLFALEQRYVS